VDLHARTALVTGASSGIGEALARRLATLGADLVIVARRRERLEALADELRAKQGVKVTVVALDLAAPDAARALFEQTEGAGVAVEVLVNNAGFGTQERFLDIPWERTAEMLQLNVVALTELTWRFGRAMAARGRGFVLNVASVGAYTPTPFYAAYAASKAYVRDMTEAVAWEIAPRGVHALSVCPGVVRTEFQQVAGHRLDGMVARTAMSAERCAQLSLDALFDGRRNVVPGWWNAFGMWLLRLLPRRTMVRIAAESMRKPDEPKRLAS
jgi:short-subunit dehydrogenase